MTRERPGIIRASRDWNAAVGKPEASRPAAQLAGLQDSPQKIPPGAIDHLESRFGQPTHLIRQGIVMVVFALMLHPHFPFFFGRTRGERNALPIVDMALVNVVGYAGVLIDVRKHATRL